VELQLAAEVEEALLDIESAAGQEQVALEGLTLADAEVVTGPGAIRRRDRREHRSDQRTSRR
jgi:hypothetical protein